MLHVEYRSGLILDKHKLLRAVPERSALLLFIIFFLFWHFHISEIFDLHAVWESSFFAWSYNTKQN